MTATLAPPVAAERSRSALLFRHEDLFQEPAYADGQSYSSDEDDEEADSKTRF